MQSIDNNWMRLALAQAQCAFDKEEVPVGAVVICNQQLIAAAHNQTISLQDPTAHAEVLTLRKAAQVLNNYRLIDCWVYVTLEPCLMCAGALMQARVQRVIYGAADTKTGVCESVLHVFQQTQLNHHTTVSGGILQQECAVILQRFFALRRHRLLWSNRSGHFQRDKS